MAIEEPIKQQNTPAEANGSMGQGQSSEALKLTPEGVRLGYPSAALKLAEGHYPVSMTRETLYEGTALEGPIEFADQSALKAFCEEADKRSQEGYWRVRSSQ